MAGVAGHAAGEATPPSGVRPSDSPHHPSGAVPPLPCRGWHVPQGESLPGSVNPALSAALCEMAAWKASDRATRDSLLLAKAEFLAEAGESARAYETVCRIQRFGLSEEQRAELLRRKLLYSWEAGLMDDFQVLLQEAQADNPGPTALSTAFSATLSGKPRHRSTDAAMLLSIIPGAGLAYAGDWANAGKYFLLQGGSIALGVGAYLSGLYVSTFLGGGMLLYTTLLPATEKAIKAATEFNSRSLKAYYAPVYGELIGITRTE